MTEEEFLQRRFAEPLPEATAGQRLTAGANRLIPSTLEGFVQTGTGLWNAIAEVTDMRSADPLPPLSEDMRHYPPSNPYSTEGAAELAGDLSPVVAQMMLTGRMINPLINRTVPLLPASAQGVGGATATGAKLINTTVPRINPLLGSVITDAVQMGSLGLRESSVVGGEQALEGAAYGSLRALPRIGRIGPAAAIAAMSKGFFDDYDAATPQEGLKRADINSVAGFITSLIPGRVATSTRIATNANPAQPLTSRISPSAGIQGAQLPPGYLQAHRPQYGPPLPPNYRTYAPNAPASNPWTSAAFGQANNPAGPWTSAGIAANAPTPRLATVANSAGPGAAPWMSAYEPRFRLSTDGGSGMVDIPPDPTAPWTAAGRYRGPIDSPQVDLGNVGGTPTFELPAPYAGLLNDVPPPQPIRMGYYGAEPMPMGYEPYYSPGRAEFDDVTAPPYSTGGYGDPSLAIVASDSRVTNFQELPSTTPSDMRALGARQLSEVDLALRAMLGELDRPIANPLPEGGLINPARRSPGIPRPNPRDATNRFSNPEPGVVQPVRTQLDPSGSADPIVTEFKSATTAPNIEAGLPTPVATVANPEVSFNNANKVKGKLPRGSLADRLGANSVYNRIALGAALGAAGGSARASDGSESGEDSDGTGAAIAGAMAGAFLLLGGPAAVRKALQAFSNGPTPRGGTPRVGRATSWKTIQNNLAATIEERAGAVVSRVSRSAIDRAIKWIDEAGELSLPKGVKDALRDAKGMGADLLDQMDNAMLKMAFKKARPEVADAVNEFLDTSNVSKLDADVRQYINDDGVKDFVEFAKVARKSITGFQDMILDGISDPRLKGIVQQSLGKYITRSYRLFTDKKFVPSHASMLAVANDMIQKGSMPGATIDDVMARLSQYVHDKQIKMQVLKEGNFGQIGQAIDQEAFKQRKDLPQIWKDFLGEETDPTRRIYSTVFRVRPMAEAAKYIDNVSRVEVDGLPQVMDNYTQLNGYKQRFEQILQNNPDDQVARLNLARLVNYEFIKDNPIYGKLAGKLAARTTQDTLKSYETALSAHTTALGQAFSGFHSAVKLGRTAYNPLTALRNIVSTPMFAMIARAELGDMAEAYKVMKDINHPLRREVMQNGISNVDMIKSEFFNEYEAAVGGKLGLGELDMTMLGMGKIDLAMAERAALRGHRNILDFYRTPDNIVRIGSYISAKRRIGEALGKPMDAPEVMAQARDFVNRYTMNYEDVSPIIKKARNTPFVNTFITYQAEMARIAKNLIEDAIHGDQGKLTNHGRAAAIAPLAMLAIGPEMLQSFSEDSLSPSDKAEWELIKKNLPDYGRTRFRFVQGKDKKGNFQYVDFSPLINSGSFNELARAIAMGDTKAAIEINPIAGWDNTPVFNILTSQVAGKDIRSNRDFRKTSYMSNIQDRVAAIAREVFPSWTPWVGDEAKRFGQAYTTNTEGELGITNTRTGAYINPSKVWSTYFGPLAGEATVPGAKIGSYSSKALLKSTAARYKNMVAEETARLNEVIKTNTNQAEVDKAKAMWLEAIASLEQDYKEKISVPSPRK